MNIVKLIGFPANYPELVLKCLKVGLVFSFVHDGVYCAQVVFCQLDKTESKKDTRSPVHNAHYLEHVLFCRLAQTDP